MSSQRRGRGGHPRGRKHDIERKKSTPDIQSSQVRPAASRESIRATDVKPNTALTLPLAFKKDIKEALRGVFDGIVTGSHREDLLRTYLGISADVGDDEAAAKRAQTLLSNDLQWYYHGNISPASQIALVIVRSRFPRGLRHALPLTFVSSRTGQSSRGHDRHVTSGSGCCCLLLPVFSHATICAEAQSRTRRSSAPQLWSMRTSNCTKRSELLLTNKCVTSVLSMSRRSPSLLERGRSTSRARRAASRQLGHRPRCASCQNERTS